ncbi:hypothetical protein VY88_01460 [Azospirillum thiophilum]|uniref:General stress protein 17M-like domain-containing protein n=1 Tax=Azospirillum thiophilum TaxID=528244 RepID=A0AAC8VZ94_9PROT|nr:hypothetical protein [Azospirillum thiophilum]ALG72183.1 hypothetical protein AL072_11250 [Azospirillum thiophilum]KJR66995.1 hypothetical protein VY88_01460 [Azospirillum thiophilum]
MTQTTEDTTPAELREVVALFTTRAGFDRAVEALLAEGFDRADLSVLASHTSLEAADTRSKPRDEALTGLVGELKYAFPLTTAGLIAIVGGPIEAALAAVVAAGVGGAAIKDYLDELTSHPKPDEFTRALEAGGVILWVRVGTAEQEARASTLLDREGGGNVHVTVREP